MVIYGWVGVRLLGMLFKFIVALFGSVVGSVSFRPWPANNITMCLYSDVNTKCGHAECQIIHTIRKLNPSLQRTSNTSLPTLPSITGEVSLPARVAALEREVRGLRRTLMDLKREMEARSMFWYSYNVYYLIFILPITAAFKQWIYNRTMSTSFIIQKWPLRLLALH